MFFGPSTGYEYLTITDNASPQENILVYSTTSGTLIGSMPFLISGTNSGNEDAAIAVGNSVYYPSTYGYQYPASAESGTSIPASAPFVGGMQRVDVLSDGSGLTMRWQSQAIVSAGEPRLSLADNLIYTIGLDTTTGTYSLITVDPATGGLVSSTPYGSAAGDNPLQMVSMISPSGVLYQGTERGLLRVEALVPEPSTLARALTGAPNLRTTFTKIITRAEHTPWPRLFQNLRASCATDWVERYPALVVAKWLGHSPMIAATHYLQTRERHFEDVVTGEGKAAAQTLPGAAPASVHICVQSNAAATSSDSHDYRQRGRKHVIVRNDANRCGPKETAVVGGEGLEPPTPSV